MSQADQDKSMDKKEIAEEEREKMLNAENTKHTGAAPAPDLESEEQKPKKKIPIGGIKMPGFCRTKSKEPCKDDETKPTEATDAESAPVVTKEKEQDNAPSAEKLTTPAKESKEKEGRKGIFNAIRIPLVSSVFSKKRKEADSELGQTGAAGLASVETLDDAANERNPIACDDGMETVRLDIEGADGAEPPPQHPLVAFVSAVKRNRPYLVAGIIILLIVITCIVCVLPKEARPQQPLTNGKYIDAVTWCGPVQGVLEDGGFAFRGIPYALPPINNRRWQLAEPVRRLEHCWNGTRLAHEPSEVCWQRQSSGLVTGTEDCLYLDVYTPAVRYDSPLPVVVMIGAETLSGGSPGIMQPSAKLSRVRDIVFVRPNFRMGIFGFLAAGPLSRASYPPTSGNYGLSDIIAALQWVQLNIENFGGNKSAVTLWGHRAGGTLVTTLVGARRSKGLFSRAWISSGSAIFPGKELERSENITKPFLSALRCADATCMRSKTAEEVMDAVPETWYTNTVGLPGTKEVSERVNRHEWLILDGIILQEHVGQIWARENNLVKMVIGTTAHAGAPQQYMQPNVTLGASQVEKIIRESLLGTSGVAAEALKLYDTTLKGLVTMISDIRVVCPLFTIARMKTNIPFYVATQPRNRHLADADSDAAAILGTYAAITPEEKRHVSAMQQLFNYYVWHNEVPQADRSGANRVLVVGQDTLPASNYSHCDFWIKSDIVPMYGRVD
ncbi:PREDICTED: neurotactin [Dinoponera quadriceps]|uniref:Neurotactin n=1 Tax=Dinoponera quadriceps TaxID=609295 RepID=A0A6P3Y494_DINQU|nr:PREDICTED: neurotactin [Dinoponera quadriceps]XP_014484934.1 PREDICTED: neurotactin [Dinoponera quadriceps]